MGKAAGIKRLSKCESISFRDEKMPLSLFLQKKINRREAADRHGDFVDKALGFYLMLHILPGVITATISPERHEGVFEGVYRYTPCM